MKPDKRPSALSSLLAKMDKFRPSFPSIRRSDASSHSQVARPVGGDNQPIRWCERAEAGNHSGGNSSHHGLGDNKDEVVIADLDREHDTPNASSSKPTQPDNLPSLDWPNSSSWPSSTPGMMNTSWAMGNTHSILPGTVNSQDESPPRHATATDRFPRDPLAPVSKAPLAPVSSPLAAPNLRASPLAPLGQAVRPVPTPVPNLVAALPGSVTTAPSREPREANATICAPSRPQKNKRIVYSDPVVQWGFRGPAIRSAVR